MLGSSGNCLGGAGVGSSVEWGSAQLSLPLETRVRLPILIHLNFQNFNFQKIQIIVSTKIIVSKKIIVSNKIIVSIIFQGISFSSLDIALLVWNLCRPIPQP